MDDQQKTNTSILPAICISIIFYWILTYGWFRTFETWGNGVTPYISALVLSTIALILAREIARQRAHHPDEYITPIAYFFVLFLISALGTINTLNYSLTGVSVAENGIKNANDSVKALQNRAAQILNTTEYDTWSSAVEANRILLNDEIINPANCGQGPEAKKRIDELQVLLPSFKITSGMGDCKKSKDLIDQYKKTIAKLINLSPEYLKNRERLDLKKEIQEQTSNLIEKDLESLQNKLHTTSDIKEIQSGLKRVANIYRGLRDKLVTIAGKEVNLKENIDITAAISVGGLGGLADFMASQLNSLTTYLFSLIAIMLDLTVIYSWRAVYIRSNTKNRPPIKHGVDVI